MGKTDCACGLPYPMGNVGDLMKHGMLAEYARWHCEAFAGGAFRFLDPFAGAAFCERANCAKKDCDSVKERGARLGKLIGRKSIESGEFALCKAQDIDGARYVGSAKVVERIVAQAGAEPEIRVSDRCYDSVKSLENRGFAKLRADGFDPHDGYSILDAVNRGNAEAKLVLLDPFADFLRDRQNEIVPRMADAAKRAAIVLFVLDMKPNHIRRRWEANKRAHLSGAWILSCPENDELRYRVEVVLAAPTLRMPQAEALRERLEEFARALKDATGENIEFSVVE